MKRQILTLSTAISLVVFVSLCVLGVRSYYTPDSLSYRTFLFTHFEVTYFAGFVRGTISIGVFSSPANQRETKFLWNTFNQPISASAAPTWWQFSTFTRKDLYGVGIPVLLLIGASLVLPLWLFRRLLIQIRIARRLASGQCGSCGYDLRAAAGRCPECGAEPVAVPAASNLGNYPRWVIVISSLSIVWGTLGALFGVVRLYDAYDTAFNPTIHWVHPPARWAVLPYFYAACLFFISMVWLIQTGIASLLMPSTAVPRHVLAASVLLLVIPFVASSQGLPGLWNPDDSWMNMIFIVVVQTVIFGAYSASVLRYAAMRWKRSADLSLVQPLA